MNILLLSVVLWVCAGMFAVLFYKDNSTSTNTLFAVILLVLLWPYWLGTQNRKSDRLALRRIPVDKDHHRKARKK